jgi:hypothetical protein
MLFRREIMRAIRPELGFEAKIASKDCFFSDARIMSKALTLAYAIPWRFGERVARSFVTMLTW